LALAVLCAVVIAMVATWMVGAALERRRTSRLVLRLRGQWGRPKTPIDLQPAGFYHQKVRGTSGWVDDATWADLNVDDVFGRIDRTESAFGREVLYHRLRTTSGEPAALEEFERTVERFRLDEAARLAVLEACARIDERRAETAWELVLDPLDPLPRWTVVFPLYAVGVAVLLGFAVRDAALLPLLLVAVCLGLALRARIGWRIAAVMRPFRAAGQLIDAAIRIAATEPVAEPTTRALKEHARSLRRLARLAAWMGRDLGRGDLGSLVLDYANVLLALDGTALLLSHFEARRRSRELLEIAELVGLLEAAISVASVRAGLSPWCRPSFLPGGDAIVAESLRHPLVESCVANSVDLSASRGVVLTGANMTGKSTFLRTVGINVLLAQTIHTCFARSYAAPWLRVRTCISPSDNLIAAKSLYQREVETAVSILAAAHDDRPMICLFDELFRGTNSEDRIGATASLIRWLLEGRGTTSRPAHHRAGTFVVAATHDVELVPLLADRCDAFHFGDAVTERGLQFDYVLQRGPATSRNAIALLGVLGAPRALVEEASAFAEASRRAKAVEQG
jgi:hypothetical protein